MKATFAVLLLVSLAYLLISSAQDMKKFCASTHEKGMKFFKCGLKLVSLEEAAASKFCFKKVYDKQWKHLRDAICKDDTKKMDACIKKKLGGKGSDPDPQKLAECIKLAT